MEMKNLKYLAILIVVIITFYVKSKMDTSNKTKTQSLDSLDDGTTVLPSSVKK